MIKLRMQLKNFLRNKKGNALTEYGLLIGIVVIGVIAILFSLRDAIIEMFQQIIDSL